MLIVLLVRQCARNSDHTFNFLQSQYRNLPAVLAVSARVHGYCSDMVKLHSKVEVFGYAWFYMVPFVDRVSGQGKPLRCITQKQERQSSCVVSICFSQASNQCSYVCIFAGTDVDLRRLTSEVEDLGEELADEVDRVGDEAENMGDKVESAVQKVDAHIGERTEDRPER